MTKSEADCINQLSSGFDINMPQIASKLCVYVWQLIILPNDAAVFMLSQSICCPKHTSYSWI